MRKLSERQRATRQAKIDALESGFTKDDGSHVTWGEYRAWLNEARAARELLSAPTAESAASELLGGLFAGSGGVDPDGGAAK